MKRQFYSPGITYATQSTLSFGPQPVVGRGAQQLHIKEAKPVSKSSTHFSATARDNNRGLWAPETCGGQTIGASHASEASGS